MARSDGRLSEGMDIATAISARAWNRAQDAADIALRNRFSQQKPRGTAPASLIVPCRVTTSAWGVAVGHVVRLAGASAVVAPQSSADTVSPAIKAMSASVITPVSLDNYADAKCALGVIVDGPTMPTPSAPRIVMVCIAGVCVARVRQRSGDFLQGPVLRGGDSAEDFIGAAEPCGCGTARILSFLDYVPNFPELKFAVVML